MENKQSKSTTMSTNAKHTPGPWSIGEPIQEQTTILSNDRFGTLICMIADNSDVSLSEQSANARLIAAAPDLAAIAEKLVYLWDAGIRPQVVKGMLREEQEFAQLIDAARAAIAKDK